MTVAINGNPVGYSPKELFQASKERRARWAELARDPIVQSALCHAHSHMAYNGLRSAEAMAGISYFIEDLLNLAEDEPTPAELPPRTLTSFEQPITVKPTTH